MSVEPTEETISETTAAEDTAAASDSQLSRFGQNKPLLFGVGGAVLLGLGGLCVICILAVLLMRELRQEETATAVPDPTPTALAGLPTGQPQIRGVSESGIISVTLGIPISLRFGGTEFDVLTDSVSADGVWTPSATGEGQASWVNNTVINYVLGLPPTDTNETLLTQLTPGDEIQLITNGRTSFTFAFFERNLVSPTDRSVYTQQTPGITLLLLSPDGADRLVVHGRALSAESPPSEPRNVVNIGETTQLDNVQLTADSAIYVADRAEIPAGFAFFQVDYTIQNVGLTALDTSTLQMTLVDELGNRYALNPAATQSGNYPILNGFLNANQSVNATAGYQVPLGLDSETVSWVVTNQDTGAQVFITLPFTGGEAAVQGASIALFRAEVSNDLTSLHLGGQITNLGTQPLIITESDIQLTAPDGAVYLLLSTNPPLPWTVAPGQTVQFFVTYQRPQGGTAVFRVLNQEFQITEQP